MTVASAALLSPCGSYRYSLSRIWGDGSIVAWVMLNPSVADASVDDPTIRACVTFSKAWGYSGLVVVNLFALRSPDPAILSWDWTAAVGPDNVGTLERVIWGNEHVVAAWGAHAVNGQDEVVRRIARCAGRTLYCLGRTKSGQPRHPLYVKRSTPLEVFE